MNDDIKNITSAMPDHVINDAPRHDLQWEEKIHRLSYPYGEA
jgi:hypothetical protein